MSSTQHNPPGQIGPYQRILLAAALLLFIVALAMAGLAARNWSQTTAAIEPLHASLPPETTSQVAAGLLSSIGESEAQPAEAATPQTVDANLAFHERIAVVAGRFILKYAIEGETFDKPHMVNALRATADKLGDAAAAADFAEGLAITLEQALADARIVGLFEGPDGRKYKGAPTHAVSALVETYTLLFFEKMEKRPLKKALADLDTATIKAAAMGQIYMAGMALMTCLLLLCMSMVLRLDGQLKALAAAHQADAGQTPERARSD